MEAKKSVLLCGGGGCCPEIEFKDDGSIVIHDTDDGRDQHIALTKEQADLLRKALR